MRALADMARARFGFEPPEEYDTVALPLPDSTALGLRLSDAIKEEATVAVGRTSEDLLAVAREKRWRLLRPQEDARYVRDNAVLSAEGAVYFAMRRAPFAMRGASVCVLGFGRIGSELARLLSCMGAEVRVCARRRIDVPLPYFPIEELESALCGAQIVFGTVPAPILTKEALRVLPRGALVVDVASPPYCVAEGAAEGLPVLAWRESGIPGRYAPRTAAHFLLEYLERSAPL